MHLCVDNFPNFMQNVFFTMTLKHFQMYNLLMFILMNVQLFQNEILNAFMMGSIIIGQENSGWPLSLTRCCGILFTHLCGSNGFDIRLNYFIENTCYF
jgi:hypothetical protein